eukprot:CAMPEP_0179900630 /NCGR_PEP_ID=MMETSP0982-20121206/39234_1 /TAXON_ID=483367 /ORGANISM="non described non described, Strain CCMP 2436" /LENGTH=47 /DNA_ID= /DNA_START= /DNA_END= /DNA_ORIENTATION=
MSSSNVTQLEKPNQARGSGPRSSQCPIWMPSDLSSSELCLFCVEAVA